MPAISGKTRVVAILGDPVSHSRSPAMHNAAFAALGLDFVYVALRVAPRDLRRALAGIRALDFAGLNVTVPHKQAIVPLLDAVTPAAERIGAVNTVFRRGDHLVGDNTDAEGFRMALREVGFAPRGKTVLLLGAGGAARAVVWGLARGRARRIVILNRTPARAREIARYARSLGVPEVESGSLDRAGDPVTVGAADLVVNGTSIGLDRRSVPPIDLRATKPTAIAYDLVYADGGTPFVRAALRGGRRAADGKRMLLHQAALAFRRWTGRRAPLDVLAKALEPA